MIITLNGDEGAGKSTAAKKIAAELGFAFYNTGQIFRDLAKKRNLTLVEYLKLGETDSSIDREVDDFVVALSNKEDNFIIDSRMAWHFIPKSLKIYLTVDNIEGAKRIYHNLQGENSRNEIKNNASLEELVEKIKERRETDGKRYKMYYGVDIREEKNYDFVLDTTNLERNEVFDKVMGFIKTSTNNGKLS